MGVYTGRGDNGKTDLYTGERIAKDHPRIHLLGTIDEVNSIIGKAHKEAEKSKKALEKIQEQLYRLQTSVASESQEKDLEKNDIIFLEDLIDNLEKQLPELKNFIYQRGSRPALELFHARAVCRRAERLAVKTEESEKTLKYLNRLSDLLFMLGRNENMGEEEQIQ